MAFTAFSRRHARRSAVAIAAAAVALVALTVAAAREPIGLQPLLAPLGPSGASLPPGATPQPSGEATGEFAERPDSVVPHRIDLYATGVSIVPGQPLDLHVSTPARRYSLEVERVDGTVPAGRVVVATLADRPGRDLRSLATIAPDTRTARANWPVTDEVASTGYLPGIYIVTARDDLGAVGHTIFVVRSPEIVAGEPLFVFSALTYEAYNLWGGANLYTYAGPAATRVSFDRPYLQDDGLGFWERGDARLVTWLQRHHAALQYTTDYDLAVALPATAPDLLIFARHTEYVPQGLRDWVNEHVNVLGDMNLANFGSNSFYWRVRLEAGPRPDSPLEVVGYKRLAGDPVAAAHPADATVKWRDPPISETEGEILGAQYVGILNGNVFPSDFVVSATMPAQLLVGTGWHPGTVLRGLLDGEGDAAYPASGGVPILAGQAFHNGAVITANSTIRTSPVGARVFDAGTFGWCSALSATTNPRALPETGIDRFTLNVLAWLGLPLA